MRSPNPSLWSRLAAVGLPFYRSEARGRAWGGLAVLLTPLLAVNGMNVVNSYVGRDFMSALAERPAGRFCILAGLLAGVFGVSTAAEVFLGFFITAIKCLPHIIPVVVVAPLYIRGGVESGAVMQAPMAFTLLETQ